ncbi:sugar transferase [Streptomyces sp. TRM49041]|uniref:sugar transferase n=1 Tax=Streptomyces sp. TRM49041 TaxID=2603216 RepID=UPI001656881F|nr:sugar transferase [Streptomyces sp. TRM49041]
MNRATLIPVTESSSTGRLNWRSRQVLSPSLVRWRGIRKVVVAESAQEVGDADNLEEEFDVVRRLTLSEGFAEFEASLTLHHPDLLLVKVSLEGLDYRLVELCRAHRVKVFVLAHPAYGLLGSARFYRFGGLPWLRLRATARNRAASARLKRASDLLLVTLGAPLVIPVMLAIVMLVCRGGPPFYFQDRVGAGGQPFRIIKFRTIRVDAEQATGPVLAAADDPRMTPFGRFLRRSRLDELPQLWNVVRGEMSLVGPRPERSELIATFRNVPHYDLRHLVRPGLTGIAQLTGGYGASVEEKLRCDLLYVGCHSPRLDLVLLARTLLDLLRGFPRG